MAKINYSDVKVSAARTALFNNINDVIEEINIHEVLKLSSGVNLPTHQMIEGKFPVFGGGGSTNLTHNNFNVDFETLAIGRVGARCGCVFKVPQQSWVTDNALYALTFDKRFDLDYLINFLNYVDLNQYANRAAQPVISLKRISSISFPLISKEKQLEFVEIIHQVEHGKTSFGNDYIELNKALNSVDSINQLQNELTYQLTQLENLNQAILQEAVQGKLVPQDPKDDPASELLKRIKAEKLNSSTSSGRRKKEKLLPPIKPEEIPFEIPKSWVWCRMEETFLTVGSRNNQVQSKEYSEIGKFPIIDQGYRFIVGYSDDASKLLIIKKPVIVFGDHTKNIKFIDFDFVIGADGTKILEPYGFVDEKWFYFFLKSLNIENRGYSRHFKLLKRNLFPLPPLFEQNRIVAAIEKQLAKTKQLKDHIIANQQATEQLLKALLHQAFEVEEMEKEVGKLKGKVAELDNHTANWDNLVAEPIESYPTYPKNNIQDIDWEMAMMVACMKNQLGVTYGDVGLQKNVYNTNNIRPIFSKQYAFANSNFGTYCHELKEDLKRNPYLTVQKVTNSKEVYIVNPKYNKQVLDKISEPANKEFVQTLNRMLSIYEHPIINKETDKIELYNTVLKVALDKNTQEIDNIYLGMKDWKINQAKYKTKAEKFTKPDAERMLKLLIEKKILKLEKQGILKVL